MPKLGVCCTCQKQDIPLASRPDVDLGLEVRESGSDNVEEYRELYGDNHAFITADHDGPHGQRCEGSGTVPQAVYDA